MGRVDQYREVQSLDENGEIVTESEVWDSYFVDDTLLSAYSTDAIEQYDLSGFVVPITDIQLAKRLDGLTTQSVRISRNFEQNSRMNEFYDRFIEPDEIVEVIDGKEVTFRDTEINLFGERGSMIHLRLPAPETARGDVPLGLLAVVSHIDDAQPATKIMATRTDTRRHDGTMLSTYRLGAPQDPSLQLVDRPTAFEWDVEQLLQADEAVLAQAEIEITSNGMRYRRSDTQWEMCGRFETLRRRVGISLSRGLGYASMPLERAESQIETGQFEQKVLG